MVKEQSGMQLYGSDLQQRECIFLCLRGGKRWCDENKMVIMNSLQSFVTRI